MERIPLESEALSSVGYDRRRRSLEVEFSSHRGYRYFDVPVGEAERLLRADSKGAYLSARVRDRYDFELVH